MIDWKGIKTRADLNPDMIKRIRIELLRDAQKRGVRMYALMIAVLLLGVNEMHIEKLKIQFLPPVDHGVDWVIIYDGKAVNMPEEARIVFNNYIKHEPNLRVYFDRRHKMHEPQPVFYSECRRTLGEPLAYCFFIFNDCMQRIGRPKGCKVYIRDVALKAA